MTGAQLPASANAPWTSTTVGPALELVMCTAPSVGWANPGPGYLGEAKFRGGATRFAPVSAWCDALVSITCLGALVPTTCLDRRLSPRRWLVVEDQRGFQLYSGADTELGEHLA